MVLEPACTARSPRELLKRCRYFGPLNNFLFRISRDAEEDKEPGDNFTAFKVEQIWDYT